MVDVFPCGAGDGALDVAFTRNPIDRLIHRLKHWSPDTSVNTIPSKNNV